ncbi:DUF4099 domain-containing protein, partial [Clostridium perfringens]
MRLPLRLLADFRYKTEDIDWDGLKAAGISKKQLEAEGNMELLLQG